MGETRNLFTIDSYEIMFLRKFISLSIIAILFFSFLSLMISTPLSKQQLEETETQAYIVDIHQSELNEEFELQDRTDIPENKEEQLPRELIGDLLLQNFSNMISNEENEASTEYEIPDIDYGEIRAVGVDIFSDFSFNNRLSSIDWGILEPGAIKYIECYVQNKRETATILTLETDNWTPPESKKHITLTWNYNNQRLEIDEIIRITFILSVSINIQGISGFSFDIIVIGSNI